MKDSEILSRLDDRDMLVLAALYFILDDKPEVFDSSPGIPSWSIGDRVLSKKLPDNVYKETLPDWIACRRSISARLGKLCKLGLVNKHAETYETYWTLNHKALNICPLQSMSYLAKID